MNKRQILMVGGAGFIGSACTLHLQQAGYETVVFDNLETGDRSAIAGTFIEGDIRNERDLEDLFSSHHFDAVLHFAAKIHPQKSLKKPAEYYDVNFNGTVKLVKSMLRHDVRRLIFSSTAAVYGTINETSITEKHKCNPETPYGISKLYAEKFLLALQKHGLLDVTCLRYFNASGAIPGKRIGERGQIEKHLIPLAIDAGLKKKNHLNIFGEDYPTFDGTCIRDYIHILDIASAHQLALQELLDGNQGDIYNLGSGTGHTVKQVVSEISKQLQHDIPVQIKERRLGDPAALITNSQKIKEKLGWNPTNSQLPEIIRSSIQWTTMYYQQNT